MVLHCDTSHAQHWFLELTWTADAPVHINLFKNLKSRISNFQKAYIHSIQWKFSYSLFFPPLQLVFAIVFKSERSWECLLNHEQYNCIFSCSVETKKKITTNKFSCQHPLSQPLKLKQDSSDKYILLEHKILCNFSYLANSINRY